MDSDSDTILREPPVAGDELETLVGALGRERSYVAWKCGGLTSAGLRSTLGPPTMPLGGLLKHLALAGDNTFHADLIRESVDGLVGEDPE